MSPAAKRGRQAAGAAKMRVARHTDLTLREGIGRKGAGSRLQVVSPAAVAEVQHEEAVRCDIGVSDSNVAPAAILSLGTPRLCALPSEVARRAAITLGYTKPEV